MKQISILAYIISAMSILFFVFILNFLGGLIVDAYANSEWIVCSQAHGRTMAGEYGLFGKTYCITYQGTALEIHCTPKNMFWEKKFCWV